MAVNFMSIMSIGKGDERVSWDPDDEEQVAAARKKFEAARKRGCIAYRVSPEDEKCAEIKEFNPAVSDVILVPLAQGG